MTTIINRFLGSLITTICLVGTANSQEQKEIETPQEKIMTKEFGDWRLRCIESEAVSDVTSSKQCEIIRIAQIQETDIAVTILTLSLTMISNENAKQQLAMTNIGPLNIYLPDQLEYKIDGKSALKAPFNTCNEAGCWSQQILDQKTIDALRKGKIAQAKFRMITGQPVTVEFTLKGISAALDEVSKNSK